MTALIQELIAGAISPTANISHLLRMAKVAAVKLKQDDARSWIDSELEGYKCTGRELPPYRQLHGSLKMWNPYHGMIPVNFSSGKHEEVLTFAPIFQSLPSIEADVPAVGKGGGLQYSLEQNRINYIIESTKTKLQPSLHLSPGQIYGIIEAVKDLVLNWALELDKQGILGEGMTFSVEDEKNATPVTQTIIAQNIGFLGTASTNASVSVEQRSSGPQQIDQRKLGDFLSQTRQALPLLPESIKNDVEDTLVRIADAKTDGETRGLLASIRPTLEGASGNLVASGILGLLASILG